MVDAPLPVGLVVGPNAATSANNLKIWYVWLFLILSFNIKLIAIPHLNRENRIHNTFVGISPNCLVASPNGGFSDIAYHNMTSSQHCAALTTMMLPHWQVYSI
jgi:hypothetical protein